MNKLRIAGMNKQQQQTIVSNASLNNVAQQQSSDLLLQAKKKRTAFGNLSNVSLSVCPITFVHFDCINEVCLFCKQGNKCQRRSVEEIAFRQSGIVSDTRQKRHGKCCC
jgi:hypothetical protein